MQMKIKNQKIQKIKMKKQDENLDLMEKMKK